MARPFDAFVIFAEMRTGSNHLEESLRALADVTCHGEVFNPAFIGQRGRDTLLGIDMRAREEDPLALLTAMLDAGETIAGFRFFHDHDPRVLDPILDAPHIAKIILSRNPVDAYVSRKIAQATDQWRLTDLKQAKSQRVPFDAAEFTEMLADWGAFRAHVRRRLQVTGQTAFHIGHDDINDAEVLSGLARFIGSAGTLDRASPRLKRQNPVPLREKVENLDAMERALSRIDPFGLTHEPEYEAPRGPGVPTFVAHPEAGLLFLPVAGVPQDPVLDWMAGVGGVGRAGLVTGMRQKDLRKWLRTHPGYCSFALVSPPAHRVARAYLRLADGADPAAELSRKYGLGFSRTLEGPELAAFCAFLTGALAGQTSLRVEPDWATQTAILQGMARVLLPQRIIREGDAAATLSRIAGDMGLSAPDYLPEAAPDLPVPAKDVAAAYRRDFIQFGFDGPL